MVARYLGQNQIGKEEEEDHCYLPTSYNTEKFFCSQDVVEIGF